MARTNKAVNEMGLDELRAELEETRIQLELRDTVVYCPKCGACGEDGCCPASMCSYVEQYQGDYKQLVDGWEMLYEGIKLYRQHRQGGDNGAAIDEWEKKFDYRGVDEAPPT